MKLTIEEINGRNCTVVRHVDDRNFPVLSHSTFRAGEHGVAYFFCGYDHYATALPPLPRNPKPEDAPLLYRYMAEGIVICGKDSGWDDGEVFNVTMPPHTGLTEITHALVNGERVEIALEG